jgi:hypothetical protein
MTETIELQVAREVDREALGEALRARGIEVEPLEDDEVLGFRIPCADGDSDRACSELLAQLESLVADAGLPLVPQRGDGFVFLRPPGD